MKGIVLPLLLLASTTVFAQQRPKEYTPSPVMGTAWNAQGNANPFIPGYFADPTIRKFGDTYYLYATTDGTGNGYGPAQVWVSKDFVNWKNIVMNWPTTEDTKEIWVENRCGFHFTKSAPRLRCAH